MTDLINKFEKKIKEQNYINTYFDCAVDSQLNNNPGNRYDYCAIYEQAQQSKDNRYITYSDRVNNLQKLNLTGPLGNQLFTEIPILVSQGVHSVIKWKGLPLFKTIFDLNIYSMIIEEFKPDTIIELGSGAGASALWLSDMCKAMNLNTHVYSFDINLPAIKNDNITFIKSDFNNVENLFNKSFYGKKIVIEDAHVNVANLLKEIDSILTKDDYLIIEDSMAKQDIIKTLNEDKYKLDQFYLDFFGTNITSCINSIFRCLPVQGYKVHT